MAQAAFWQGAMVLMPLAAAIVTPAAAVWLGAFETFRWTGRDASALATLGIMGTVCFPFAVHFFARMRRDQALARESQAWPTVAGVVQSSQVERQRTRSLMQHCLKVRYAYEVCGRTYEGDTLAFGPRWFVDETKVEQLARKYPARAAVRVHVDPSAPDNAVLETSEDLARQADWRIWINLGAPFVGALIASLRSLMP